MDNHWIYPQFNAFKMIYTNINATNKYIIWDLASTAGDDEFDGPHKEAVSVTFVDCSWTGSYVSSPVENFLIIVSVTNTDWDWSCWCIFVEVGLIIDINVDGCKWEVFVVSIRIWDEEWVMVEWQRKTDSNVQLGNSWTEMDWNGELMVIDGWLSICLKCEWVSRDIEWLYSLLQSDWCCCDIMT